MCAEQYVARFLGQAQRLNEVALGEAVVGCFVGHPASEVGLLAGGLKERAAYGGLVLLVKQRRDAVVEVAHQRGPGALPAAAADVHLLEGGEDLSNSVDVAHPDALPWGGGAFECGQQPVAAWDAEGGDSVSRLEDRVASAHVVPPEVDRRA